MWKIGDPFVGDPPQEPQGRNSIFISDTSTLRIIGEHARDMLKLGTAGSFITSKNR
jgi:mannan endo-1,4-beta-mannosidase